MKYKKFTDIQALPDDMPQGKMGECISNTIDTAIECGLEYAEGIAKGTVGLWYRHAWNVDTDGSVIDTTWVPASIQYIGRIIPLKDKVRRVVEAEVYVWEDDCPFVPDGECGLECYTREQVEWIKKQLRK